MEMCFVLTRVMASRDESYVLWASLSHTAASMREVQPDVVRERVYPRQWALKGSTSNPKLTVFLYAMRRASGDRLNLSICSNYKDLNQTWC